jgi:hypothetical protein
LVAILLIGIGAGLPATLISGIGGGTIISTVVSLIIVVRIAVLGLGAGLTATRTGMAVLVTGITGFVPLYDAVAAFLRRTLTLMLKAVIVIVEIIAVGILANDRIGQIIFVELGQQIGLVAPDLKSGILHIITLDLDGAAIVGHPRGIQNYLGPLGISHDLETDVIPAKFMIPLAVAVLFPVDEKLFSDMYDRLTAAVGREIKLDPLDTGALYPLVKTPFDLMAEAVGILDGPGLITIIPNPTGGIIGDGLGTGLKLEDERTRKNRGKKNFSPQHNLKPPNSAGPRRLSI